jgi:predicted permease
MLRSNVNQSGAMTRRSEDDFAREIDAHLALEADRLIADGVDPAEARDRARRAFGNVTRAQERFHEARRIGWLEDLWRDVRSAWRNVRRNPISAAVIVLSLAGGIGAATIALVVRNVIFYNPPPLYQAPDELAKVQAAPRDRPILPAGSDPPAALVTRWREVLGDRLAASIAGRPAEMARHGGVDQVVVRAVTPNLFALLGIRPEVGRLFDPGRSGVAGEAVLGYGMWQQAFGGRADIAGTTIRLNGRPVTIVGVAPQRFWFSGMGDQLWVAVDPRLIPGDTDLEVIVRRRPGMSNAALTATLQRGLDAHNRERAPNAPALHMRVSPVRGTPMGAQMSLALPYIFGFAVTLILFLGCANAAILLIAQWTARETDTAVRSSLGAGRGRLIRALLTEAVLLSTTAGVGSVLAALGVRWWIATRSGSDQTMFDLSIPPHVIGNALLISIGAGMLAALAPALYETARLQTNPLRGLQASDRTRHRWSNALVIAEISVTVGLLVMTTSMVTAYQRIRNARFGFDTSHIAVTILTNPNGIAVRPLLDRARAVPGVRTAAMAVNVPLFGGRSRQDVATNAAGDGATRVETTAITSDFFATFAVAMREGRAFDEHEGPESGVAIINETLAQRLFGRGPFAGRQLWIDNVPHAVVGVVRDYATSWTEFDAVTPKAFVPLAPQHQAARGLVLVAQADGNPTALLQPLQRAIRTAGDRDTAVTSSYTYSGMLGIISNEWLVSIAPLGALVAIGIALTAAGIYGMLAFAIARRTRELAVRVALGATARDQAALISGRSARLVAIGAGGSLGFAFLLAQIARVTGGAGSYMDPPWTAFVLPVLIMAVVAAIATWLPMRRARRIDPSILLRTT